MTNNESDSSREWASQAYALLKQKQELKKQEEELRQEELKAEQLKEEELKEEQLKVEVNKKNFSNLQDDTEVKLGEFDDDFTWSAMVWLRREKK